MREIDKNESFEKETPDEDTEKSCCVCTKEETKAALTATSPSHTKTEN